MRARNEDSAPLLTWSQSTASFGQASRPTPEQLFRMRVGLMAVDMPSRERGACQVQSAASRRLASSRTGRWCGRRDRVRAWPSRRARAGNFASPLMRFATTRVWRHVAALRTGHVIVRAVHASERRHSASATPTLVAGRRWQASCWGTCNSGGAPESFVPSRAPIVRLRRSVVTTAAALRRVSIGRRAPGSRAGSDASVMRREREREQDKGVRRL